MMTEIEKNECIACKGEIHPDATICSICHSYQKPWKNNLKFLASIVGIISMVGALFVYSISKEPEIRKAFFWRDNLSVISFVAYDHITVANIGDGTVFLSHVSFSSNLGKANFSNVRHLGITIEPGDVKQINLPAQYGPNILKNHYVTVGGVDDANWSEIIKKSFSGRYPCYVYNVFYTGDPGFLNVKNFYSNGSKSPLRTFEAKASITFISLKNNSKLNYDFPVIGTTAIDTRSDGCKPE